MTDVRDQVAEATAEVYAALGVGYEERVYEEAMAVEFREQGISYEVEHNTEIFYKGAKVGVHPHGRVHSSFGTDADPSRGQRGASAGGR